jgi:phosphopantothenoylcysteine decarboxylase / phosphopantothenate---cysteine ligase
MLSGKKILLGVTGGIAAYKAAYFVRELKRAGADVRVIMTESATRFIAPLTLSTLSQHEVIVSMWPASPHEGTDVGVEHVHLGLWADVMLILPASANTIAKLAYGIADNALTVTALSLRCSMVVAPAMDLDMYKHPATVKNISILRERGVEIIEPESGELASGLSGPGRLPELQPILERLERVLSGGLRDLEGVAVLVTAGPTYEAIDPVRFIGNRSSGKMGFAIARAAAARGALVTLISGPSSLETPAGITRINIESAREMFDAVRSTIGKHTVLVMAAAVSDFRTAKRSSKKIKKETGPGKFTLNLIKNEDILRYAGKHKNGKTLIGFALETENEIENAAKKMKSKNLDYIVVNNPTVPGAAFGSDTNKVTILGTGGFRKEYDIMSKTEVAHRILDLLTDKRND